MSGSGGVKTFLMTNAKQTTGLEGLAADLRALGLTVCVNRPLAELGTFPLADLRIGAAAADVVQCADDEAPSAHVGAASSAATPASVILK